MTSYPTGTIVSSETGETLPLVGLIYTDHQERKLRVTEVHEGARDGREVIGRIFFREDLLGAAPGGRPFSTTLRGWLRVWHHREPPTPIERMRIG